MLISDPLALAHMQQWQLGWLERMERLVRGDELSRPVKNAMGIFEPYWSVLI